MLATLFYSSNALNIAKYKSDTTQTNQSEISNFEECKNIKLLTIIVNALLHVKISIKTSTKKNGMNCEIIEKLLNQKCNKLILQKVIIETNTVHCKKIAVMPKTNL